MALTINRAFDLSTKLSPICLLSKGQVRWRNRVNLKNPLPMHYKRKRMLILCEPVLKKDVPICENVVATIKPATSIVDENPYALFLAGQMRRDFAAHKLVAIYHTDSFNMTELLKMRLHLHDNNYPFVIKERINGSVAAAALKGTRWAPLLPLFTSRTALGFSNCLDVAKLLRLWRKLPAFVLLGLVYEDRILHRDDIDKLAKLSSILAQYSQLSNSLSGPAANLSHSLMMGQVNLTNSLDSYVKNQKEESSSSSSSSSDSSSSDSSSSDSEGEDDKKK